MNTKHLEYIMMIEQERSISKAAKKLFMTQPALSTFLAREESAVGLPLFERSSEGLVPTYAGECYLTMAKEVIKLNRRLSQELCEIEKSYRGRVTIGTTVHIGTCVLPELISTFQQYYPNIEINIIEGSSHILETEIERGNVDLALMHLPLRQGNADYVEIARERYVMTFSKTHALYSKIYYKEQERYPYIDVREARNEKFILAHPNQRVRQVSDEILFNAGFIPEIALMTSSVHTALDLAGIGLGVTFLPESYIHLFNRRYDTVFCYMEDEFRGFWSFAVVYPRHIQLSKPVEKLIEITRAIYPQSCFKLSTCHTQISEV